MEMIVCWKINDLLYSLMQVRPSEIAQLLKKNPDFIGIPSFWAVMEDGDFAWWPNSFIGEPDVQIRNRRVKYE